MYYYIKVFANPYPGGWKNLPSIDTPIVASALQQHTNAITNIENYLYSHPMPNRTSELDNDSNFITRAQVPEFPENLSEFNNDVGFITEDDIPSIPTKTSDLINDSNFVTSSDVPRYISDLDDDIGIVYTDTDQLINYYKKTELYSKTQIDELVSELEESDWNIEIVDELPEVGKSNVLYLVPKNSEHVLSGLISNHVLDYNPIPNENYGPLDAEEITDGEVIG